MKGLLERNPSVSTAGGEIIAQSTSVSVLRQNNYQNHADQKSVETTATKQGDRAGTRGMLFDSSHDKYDYQQSRDLIPSRNQMHQCSEPDIVTLMPSGYGAET